MAKWLFMFLKGLISVRPITVSLALVCSQQHKLKRQCDMKNEDITLYTNEVEQLASHPWESNWTITEMRRTHALFLWLCEYPCAPAFLPSHHQQLHVWILCWPCDAQTYFWTQDAQPLSPEYKPLRYFKWPLVSVWFLVPVLCVSLHHIVFCVFAAIWWCSESRLPVKSGVSSPPLWTERAEASLVTQQLWQRSLMELREVCFLFVFTTEKSAEVAFLWALHPLPPSLCSSPLPLASGISRGKPGKLWLYCFHGTKTQCEILLLVPFIEQEWELWRNANLGLNAVTQWLQAGGLSPSPKGAPKTSFVCSEFIKFSHVQNQNHNKHTYWIVYI